MPKPVRRNRAAHPGGVALVTLLALLTVAVLIIGNSVFVVRRISVEGNRLCTAQEVIDASGISMGDGMFSIDTKKVREGIDNNRYLHYVGMWRDFPNHIILTVLEDSPHATMMWMGMLVMLGKDGTVLEKTPQIDISLGVPVITGAKADSAVPGSQIIFSQAGQLDAVQNILEALERFGLAGDISELNVAVLDNLYLVTSDGLQVMLGDSEKLTEKIILLDTVLPQLRGMRDVRGGVLDVSTGEAVDFQPARI